MLLSRENERRVFINHFLFKARGAPKGVSHSRARGNPRGEGRKKKKVFFILFFCNFGEARLVISGNGSSGLGGKCVYDAGAASKALIIAGRVEEK